MPPCVPCPLCLPLTLYFYRHSYPFLCIMSRAVRASPYPALSVAQAIQALIEAVPAPLFPAEQFETLGIHSALNRVLTCDATANFNAPSSDRSIWDGYALCCKSDCTEASSLEFQLVGSVHAGSDAGASLSPGQAAYVTTGAGLPPGTDRVVPIELTTGQCNSDGDEIRVVLQAADLPKLGSGIRAAGSDSRVGDCIVPAGTLLTPEHIGACIAARIEQVRVSPRLRIAIAATGDELSGAHSGSQSDTPHSTPDSNTPTLLSLATTWGSAVQPVQLPHVADTLPAALDSIQRAHQCAHVLITTGGVSMGERDFVKPALAKLGHVTFGRVAIKPGKPTTLAVLPADEHHEFPLFVLALPGNPASAWVGWHMWAQPLFRLLLGLAAGVAAWPASTQVTCLHALAPDAERPEMHRAVVWSSMLGQETSERAPAWAEQLASSSGAAYSPAELLAITTGNQRSSRAGSLQRANALLLVPAGTSAIAPGSSVPALLVGRIQAVSQRWHDDMVRQAASAAPARSCCGCGATPTGQGKAGSAPSIGARRHHHTPAEAANQSTRISAAVLTVSDSASADAALDTSGPLLCGLLQLIPGLQVQDMAHAIVPDDTKAIQAQIQRWAKPDTGLPMDIIITTGGTGFAPRDVTPEAVSACIDRPAPGLVWALMAAGTAATPMAVLARPVAGVMGSTLLVTLPGSPKAVREGVQALAPVLPHALKLLQARA